MTQLKDANGTAAQTYAGIFDELDAIDDKLIVHLNDYLPAVFVSGSTDCTAAITAWAVAAQAVGDSKGAVVMTASPGVYNFTCAISGIMGTFTGIAVEINAPGAVFADQQTYTGTQTGRLFRFVTCRGVRVKYKATSEHQSGTAVPGGMLFCELRQGSTVDHVSVDVTGGREAVSCVKFDSDPESYKVRGGRIDIRSSGTFYGWAGSHSGCDMEVHVDADDAGRAFIFYDVQNVRVYARTKNQRIASSISSEVQKGVSNIYVNYVDRESTLPTSGITLTFKGNTVGSVHRDIHFHLDVLQTVDDALVGSALSIVKKDDAGATDNTGRGHILDGFKVTGSIEYGGTGYTRDMFDHYSARGEMVTPDVMRNIDISDLSIKSSSASDRTIFRLTCLDGIAHVRNVKSTQDFMPENLANSRVVLTGCKAKRLSRDTADAHTYVDCEATGALQAAGTAKRFVGVNTGTGMASPVGSKTFDFPSVADGAMTSTTVTATGAVVGEEAVAKFSLAIAAGGVLSAQVTATDTITVTLFNKTGAPLDLASGTLSARVVR